MKSRLFLIIIPLAFILIIFTMLDNTFGNAPEEALYKAFVESGAEIAGTEMTFSGTGSGRLLSDRDFFTEVTGALGHNLPISPETVDNDSFIGLEINNSRGSDIKYNIKIIQSKTEAEKGKCYVTLYITDGSTAPQLTDIKSKMAGIFRKYGVTPSINTCFTGSYEGRLDNTRIDEICAGIFSRTYARKVNGIRDNNLMSVSAYSGSIRESVSVDGKEVNIGFAARYNSYEDRTYIWLATPLITTEY